MADLPQERVTQAKSFGDIDLDFARPLVLEPGFKTYIALFICFCTKALHLEMFSDSTEERCSSAIKRFIAR